MKRKSNIKGSLPDFIRYIRGEMTKREENVFQRQLQKDPFAEEAAEGLSEILPEEAVSDLDKLGSKLKTRIHRRQRFIYYRIAASVAVLMIVSSVFIIVNKNKTGKEPLETTLKKVTLEIPESKGIEATEEIKSTNIIAEPEPEPKAEEPVELIEPVKSVTADITPEILIEIAKEKPETVIPEKPENLIQTGAKGGERLVSEDSHIQPKAALPGKAAPAAVGGAMKKSEYKEINYSPPEPSDGMESFDLYVEENIRKPLTLPDGQRAVVELNLLVESTGAIDSIQVTSSPGIEFSEEAIRLIKEGPEWKPAVENGRAINDGVKIKIVFYKNNDDENLPE